MRRSRLHARLMTAFETQLLLEVTTAVGSQRDAADKLGIPYSTFKYRLARTRHRLKLDAIERSVLGHVVQELGRTHGTTTVNDLSELILARLFGR